MNRARSQKIVMEGHGSYLGMEKGCFVLKDKQGIVDRYPLFENERARALAVGLGAAIGIIELFSSDFPRHIYIIIFEFLIILGIFSFSMITSHMSDVYRYKEELDKLPLVSEFIDPLPTNARASSSRLSPGFSRLP